MNDWFVGQISATDDYANKIERDLELLTMDKETSASKYTNKFTEFVAILQSWDGKESVSKQTKLSKFLTNILDDDYADVMR